MPEARLEAARKCGLPSGYQFGDAAPRVPAYLGSRIIGTFPHRDRLLTDLMPPVYSQPHGVKLESA